MYVEDRNKNKPTIEEGLGKQDVMEISNSEASDPVRCATGGVPGPGIPGDTKGTGKARRRKKGKKSYRRRCFC